MLAAATVVGMVFLEVSALPTTLLAVAGALPSAQQQMCCLLLGLGHDWLLRVWMISWLIRHEICASQIEADRDIPTPFS